MKRRDFFGKHTRLEMSHNPWMTGIDSDPHSPQRNMHPQPSLPAGANPKKKRRMNGKAAARSLQTAECADARDVQVQNLCPPPLSCFGDTVSVANPFDDITPRSSRSIIQPCDLPQMRSDAMGHMNGQPMRVIDSMGGMRASMHDMGAMHKQIESYNDPAGGVSLAMSDAPMSPINNMGSNRPPGAMNRQMRNQGNPVGSMGNAAIVSPVNNMGAHINQMHVGGMSNNGIIGRAAGNRMARPLGTIVNGNNRYPMTNSGSDAINGLPWMNNVPFGRNGSQPRHMGMNLRMDSKHVAPMGSTVSSNMNISGKNLNNMARMPHRNIISRPIGSFATNMARGPAMGNPIVMGDDTGYHGCQPNSGMRLTNPATDKIYVSDQPMIFNHQNRNAPPIYICGACHKEVNDNNQGIVCESGCNFWFHRACVGLTEAAFQLLNEQVFAEWVCDKCLKMKNVPPVKFRT